MGHIVRNAWSRRCSHNAHGHSYTVEFLFESDNSDNGQMACDFGFLKKYINPFVDSFDHSFVLWNIERDKHIIDFFKQEFERVIVTDFSSTAEMQAKMFFKYGQNVLNFLLSDKNTLQEESYTSLPKDVRMNSVIVHETATGYAKYTDNEADNFPDTSLKNIWVSDGIKNEWPEKFRDQYSVIINS
jgi:6-pyruvoyltetrahydropterin/6-carboxytetrahydropterin synthase